MKSERIVDMGILLLGLLPAIYFAWPIYSGQISPLIFADYEFIHLASFVQARNFSFGGLSFWNPYDQVDLSYLYSVGGLDFISTFAGLVYYVLARLNPTTSLQTVTDIVNFGVSALARAFGVLLLARMFTRSRFIQLVSVLSSALFLSSPMYLGLNTSNIYSFAPLFLAAVLHLVSSFAFRNLAYVVSFLAALFVSNPLITAGYFYQSFHAVILMTMVVGLWRLRGTHSFRKFRIRELFMRLQRCPKARLLKWSLWVGFLLIFLLPTLLMLRWLSGHTNLSTNRISNVFSLGHYLKSDHYGAPVGEILSQTLFPEIGTWHGSWIFLGGFFVVVSLIGLCVSREDRVWIPFLGYLFVVALQLSRTGPGLGTLVHSINFFSNPASSLSRSLHMSALLSPWLLLPSFIRGSDWTWTRVRGIFGGATRRIEFFSTVLLASVLMAAFFVSTIQSYKYVQSEFESIISVQQQERKFIDAWTIGIPSRHEPIRSYVDLGARIDNPGYLNTNPIGHRGILLQEMQLGIFAQPPRFYRPRSQLWNSIDGMVTTAVDQSSLTTDFGFLVVGEESDDGVVWRPRESGVIRGSLSCRCLFNSGCLAGESEDQFEDLWFSQEELSRKELWIDGKQELSTMATINRLSQSRDQICRNESLRYEVSSTYSALNTTRLGPDVETIEIKNNVSNAYLVLLRPPTENLEISVNDVDRDVETLSGKELAIPLALGSNVVQVHYAVNPILRIGLPVALLMGFVFLLCLSVILFRNISQETEGGSLRN